LRLKEERDFFGEILSEFNQNTEIESFGHHYLHFSGLFYILRLIKIARWFRGYGVPVHTDCRVDRGIGFQLDLEVLRLEGTYQPFYILEKGLSACEAYPLGRKRALDLLDFF
jgi:hypothetical protein